MENTAAKIRFIELFVLATFPIALAVFFSVANGKTAEQALRNLLNIEHSTGTRDHTPDDSYLVGSKAPSPARFKTDTSRFSLQAS